jgi:uncharacterized protein
MNDALLTPSKITAWLDCGWYLTLKNGDRSAELNHPGPLAELLMEKGLTHENACLAEFEAQDRRIYRTPDREENETFARWVTRVGNPMNDEWDVIYQFPMVHDGMRGIADFLVRVDTPDEGKATFEPYDAKLARQEAKPGHVLQLCFYADALEALVRRPPRQMHLWLGSGEVQHLDVEPFGPYWRRLRRRLAEVMDTTNEDAELRPEPCSYCDFCEYSQHCETIWREADSLIYVAGIRKRERDALEAADIATVAELAGVVQPTPGVQGVRQTRLREQADLQVVSRDLPSDPPAYRPVPLGDDPVWGHGYASLPEPDPGDVFFDLEGHPFWTPAAGLFFLFGLWYLKGEEWSYEARWAHDLEAQNRVAAGLLDFFESRRETYPEYHVYHYNHTERSALAAMTLGTPSEALLTHLNDTGLFVDLMTVAVNSFQVGVESYGLKSLETLTGFQRQGPIEQGVGAVVDYEHYMQNGDPELLEGIASYNKDDVLATNALRDWLIAQRPADTDWRDSVLEEYEVDPEIDLLAEQLLVFPPETTEHLLGDLLGYWRRERSADVGPKFAQLEADTHVLLDDPDFIAGLSFENFEDHQGARGELKYASSLGRLRS